MKREPTDREGMAEALEMLGGASFFTGDPARAVKDFFGRVIELFRTLGDRQKLSSTLAVRALDAAPETIDDTSLRERFLHTALDLLPREKPPLPREVAKQAFGGLTPREREVAALIAQGKTSREMADLLVVSERTAEVHVSNILGKLGFTSRAQIAAWAVEKGLSKR